jgi:hypothetical protein
MPEQNESKGVWAYRNDPADPHKGVPDMALAPWTYPLRGQILCWLFWKCWLNPVCWFLRIFFHKHNPYRRLVAVFDPTSAVKSAEEAVSEAKCKHTTEGTAEELKGE